jgi:hypothetical protein
MSGGNSRRIKGYDLIGEPLSKYILSDLSRRKTQDHGCRLLLRRIEVDTVQAKEHGLLVGLIQRLQLVDEVRDHA